MKEGYISKSAVAGNEDMELINRFTRKELKPEEVYTFSVLLCDNDVDRDYEKFSPEALSELAKLFVGKTGIFDHERRSSGQAARIYSTELKTEPGKKTKDGEEYVYLSAMAYIPRSDGNRELISKIDSGILKEVSVGCSVGSSRCSICGKENCSHIKGRSYGGKTCVHILSEARDAYEFSFVAVPSQRMAGVRKNYDEKEEILLTDKIKSLSEGESLSLSFEECRELIKEHKELCKEAEWGRNYRESLVEDSVKYSRMIQPGLKTDTVKTMLMNLSVDELKETGEVWKSLAEKKLPLRSQLPELHSETKQDNKDFRI